MQVFQANDVKVYNLTAGKALPQWISERKRRRLIQKDPDLQRRVELIQDFTMPTASTTLRISPDNRFVFATGTYKPRVRCYEFSELSMKFERYLDGEVITFEVLSEDYSKLVFLRDDRHIELHAQYGVHYRTRIPTFGRTMTYNPESCDVYSAGVGSEIYRLNLDQGRFLKPMTCAGDTQTVNCSSISAHHGLLTVGTSQGLVEAFDPRTQGRVAVLDVARCCLGDGADVPQVTSLAFLADALTLAAGTSTGRVLLFDVRSGAPTLVKDHNYDLPIKRILAHPSGNIISTDERVVKVWNAHSGDNFTTIEHPSCIHDVAVCPNSGLLFLANEAEKMGVYFIPV